MANVRMTKKIKEIISKYNTMIRAEKLTTVNAITKDSKLAKEIVDWMDYHKTVGKSFINFSHSNYDDWGSAITFYFGKKPKDLEHCYFKGSYKVSKEMLEFLKDYKEDNLESKKEMNEWLVGLQDKANKKEQVKQREKNAKLDLDGEITLKEISEQYKDMYVNSMKSKISFHKRIDSNHHKSVPEFTIKIKPARKDYNDNGWFMEVYNKAEFEEAMKNAVKKIEISEDLVKYALSMGVTINANKRNEIELRYSYDGTNNCWYTGYKSTLPTNSSKTEIENAIKTFGDKRKSRIH